MTIRSLFILLFFALYSAPAAEATHIAGAELTYECVGNDQYQFKLKLYRDCQNGQAGFDNSISLFVFFGSNNTLFNTFSVPAPFQTPRIIPENWNACTASPNTICVEEGIYQTTISLPAVAGGYNVAWARCCRNGQTVNLSSPLCEGVTFLAHVPEPALAVCNSMPEFNQQPPIFLCAGELFTFNYSATDPDGDSLSYEISNPYTGTNTSNLGAGNNTGPCGGGQPGPVVDQFGNPMGPPPYRNVAFAPGHSFQNPFGPGSFITINPTTGWLQASPANLGIYVLAISVKEWRNGQLISENKRDFQFHVISCLPQGTPPILTHDLSGLPNSGDTIFAEAARPFCYDFTLDDTTTPSTLIVTPISTSFGGNGGFPPPYATITMNGNSPPVYGQICWRPSCDYIGQTIDMIISARDTNDCPNYNIVFDTIWVTVVPSPNIPPAVYHDLSGNTFNGDTLIVNVQQNFCFDFMVVDTLGDGSLLENTTVHNASGPSPPQSHVVTTSYSTNGDTLWGEVCWDVDCTLGNLYYVVIEGIDDHQCFPYNTTFDTVWIKVVPPSNPAPTTDLDPLSNPMSGDTLLANVHELLCFDFSVSDTSGTGDSIYFSYTLLDLQGSFGGQQPSITHITTGNTLNGEFCWTPRCLNVDQIFRMVVTGVQVNLCNATNSTSDTIYIRVSEPLKPPPVISHDLGPNFPDNLNVVLNDNDAFCYTFELRDTVVPTLVDYRFEVDRLNGQPFLGPMPVLTFSTQLDDLIQGEICWEIPCEFANESFRIVMMGTDTFDCHSGNVVLDTINVQHIENIPGIVDLCAISVLPGDISTELNWIPGPEPDLEGYVILRRRSDEAALVVIDTVWGAGMAAYTDMGVEADDFVYCYAVKAFDRCDNASPPSEEDCTVLLTGGKLEYSSVLNWTPYMGWDNGIFEYEVHRSIGGIPGSEANQASLSPNFLTYQDKNVTEPILCYRIRSTENGSGCGVESWSNEICLTFPPTLYLPNAFTPNGDLLNDIFTSYGDFIREFDLKIYDRWGKVLFSTQNLEQGWDGSINGRSAPEGVYVYRVKVVGYDEQILEMSGSVTLLR